MGLDPLHDFLWKPAVKPDTLNAMILSWPMKEMPAEAGKDEEALYRAGIYEWFVEGEYIYIRPKQEPRAQRLADFFVRTIERCGWEHGTLITPTESWDVYQPEAWFQKWDKRRLRRRADVVKIMKDTRLRCKTRCPLACEFPEDLDAIHSLATWYLSLHGGTNMYLIPDDRTKLLVCHEGDLHFCGKDHQQIRSICEDATSFGLYVAPFSNQQCM
jgi:hypothetical protein